MGVTSSASVGDIFKCGDIPSSCNQVMPCGTGPSRRLNSRSLNSTSQCERQCEVQIEVNTHDYVKFFEDPSSNDGGLMEQKLNVKALDFKNCNAVPHGWKLTEARVPEGFLYAGGYARIIVKVDEESRNFVQPGPNSSFLEEWVEASGPSTSPRVGREDNQEKPRHILLALPDWAVDVYRAKSLIRHTQAASAPKTLCRLWRAVELKHMGVVVLEFSEPPGNCLKEITQDDLLSEKAAQMLCRDLQLMLLSSGMNMYMRLWGLLDDTLVFLDSSHILSGLLPLGFLLTFAGASAVAMRIAERGDDSELAPELKKAVVTKVSSSVSGADVAYITDSFAIAALTYRALAGKDVILERRMHLGLEDAAQDLLTKMLYEEPQWRLCGHAALAHPWLRAAPQNPNMFA